LGIGALVIGVLSFFVCWIPFLGIAVSGLGLLLGLGGLLLAIVRRGSGVGFSIAGSGLCAFSLVVCLVWTSALSNAFKAVDDAVAKQTPGSPERPENLLVAPASVETANAPRVSAEPLAPTTREPERKEPQKTLTAEEIIAKYDASVALIKGKNGAGTGFLVRPGMIATNAHVVNDELTSDLQIQFLSAPEGKRGPTSPQLLYLDRQADLALLGVRSDLPPLELAVAYHFRKGQEITVIGNPAYGGRLARQMLQNAVTRGIMSTTAQIKDMPLYQMSIAINPGNSGGPVIASDGTVVGVVVARGVNSEGIAFSIPVEELQKAIGLVDSKIANKQLDIVRTERELKGLGDPSATALRGRGRASGGRPTVVSPSEASEVPESWRQTAQARIYQLEKNIATLKADGVAKAKESLALAEQGRIMVGVRSGGVIKTGAGRQWVFRSPKEKEAMLAKLQDRVTAKEDEVRGLEQERADLQKRGFLVPDVQLSEMEVGASGRFVYGSKGASGQPVPVVVKVLWVRGAIEFVGTVEEAPFDAPYRMLLFRGVKTAGVVDNDRFQLEKPYRVVSTTKVGATTMYVLQPVAWSSMP
jgi:S1-C subfamily serine protease